MGRATQRALIGWRRSRRGRDSSAPARATPAGRPRDRPGGNERGPRRGPLPTADIHATFSEAIKKTSIKHATFLLHENGSSTPYPGHGHLRPDGQEGEARPG